jgi:hypothetical protein
MRTIVMSRGSVTDQVLEALRRTPDCQIDELAVTLPNLTWMEVFLEVGRLSRMGQVHVALVAENCTVRLQNTEERNEARAGK